MLETSAWSEFVSGLEAADICGLLIDVDSGRILWAGPRFASFAGMTPRGLAELRAGALFTPGTVSVLSEAHATGPVREFPIEVITADRGTCRAAADLNPVHIGERECTLVKIHRARAASENLGTDEQFRALVDTIPVPAFIWRPDTYEILYLNGAMEETWGFPRTHVEGRRVDEFVVNLDRLREQVEQRLRGASYSPVEFEIRDEFNTVRTWIASSSVINFGGAIALITAVTDLTAREKMAQALRRSERSFSLLVNSVPEGILVHCEGRVAFANPVALEMCGYESLEDLKDVPVIELIHRDDRPKVAKRVRAVIEERLQLEPMHERVLNRDGSSLDVEITASPTEFDGKPAALIIARDISERIEREAALRASEAKYRTLVESVNDTIFQLDAQGRFTFFSNNGNADFLAQHDIVGCAFSDFIHPDDLKALKESYKDTLGGRLKPHEFRVKGNNSEWLHVRTSSRPIFDADGNVTGLIGVMVDLTDRIQQENTVRESAAKLEEATRLARISTWESDPVSGEWDMSREIFDLLGIGDLPPADRIETFVRMVPEEDFARVRDLTIEAINNTDHMETDFRCVVSDDDIRYLRTAARVQRDANGRPIRVYGATQDITALKRQEDDRLQIEVQLQRAQKLDSLTVLAGGVAHDFNNLLTGILGYSELLKNAIDGSDKLERYVDEIQNITRRAAELTRQLLAYSGRGKFLVKPLHLPEMVQEFKPLLEAVVPRGIALILEAADNVPTIKADSTQVKQVLMNLVLNAAESLETGSGTIRVAVGECTIEHSLSSDENHPLPAPAGRYVTLEVADNGVGMEPDQLRRVCDPFFSTKFVGRGLGLSAVHGIVQSHHGGMHIASEPGCGTTVEILLPIETASAPRPRDSRPPDAARTVLVVDDESAVRDVVKDILETAGFAVLQACNGQECLEVLSDARRRVDLVILDLTMPRMSGEETLERLRADYPRTPVILASGYSQQQMEERFNGNGPSAFLQKPFNARHLIDTVKAGLVVT